MKTFLALIVLTLHASCLVAQSDSETPFKNLWFGVIMGGSQFSGFGDNASDGGYAFGAFASTQYNEHYFGGRYHTTVSEESYGDVALMYGRALQNRSTHVSIAAGPSIFWGSEVDKQLDESTSLGPTIGLAAEARCCINIIFVQLGLYGYSNLSSEGILSGVGLSLALGGQGK